MSCDVSTCVWCRRWFGTQLVGAPLPLLVAGPDIEPGSVDRLTSNVDLVPTFLQWAGVEPGAVDGTSIADALRGEHVDAPEAVLLRGCGLEGDAVSCIWRPN